MREHTPGKWRAVGEVVFEEHTDDIIAQPGDNFSTINTSQRLNANAALIAAAPETAAERDELRKGKKMWLYAAIELEAERDRLKTTVKELLRIVQFGSEVLDRINSGEAVDKDRDVVGILQAAVKLVEGA